MMLQSQEDSPLVYMSRGWRLSPLDQIRPDLLGVQALRVALMFRIAEVSPQELTMTAVALEHALSESGETSEKKFIELIDSSLAMVSATRQRENHAVLVKWLQDFQPFIRTTDELECFLSHLLAVLKQDRVLLQNKFERAGL
jgi:hypothetical protein